MSTATESESGVKAAARAEAVTGGNVGDLWRGTVVWPDSFNGWVNFRINWDVINPNSMVIVTATETDANGVPFVGNAAYTVANIAPSPGFVVVKINIGWDTPLRIRTDVSVLN